MKKLAGIDYSTSSPAITIINTETNTYKFFNLHKTLKYVGVYDCSGSPLEITRLNKEFDNNEVKFRFICNWATTILENEGVECVGLEDYSFGSTGLLFQIAENTSLLKQWLNINGIEFDKFAPTTIKKQFCGRGNAKKPEMIDWFNTLLPFKFNEVLNTKLYDKNSPENDLVDSFAILKCLLKLRQV